MGEFKEILKELRQEKGVTQKELATAIGVSFAAISFWETGINEPKVSYILALSDYFDVSVDYLLGKTEY